MWLCDENLDVGEDQLVRKVDLFSSRSTTLTLAHLSASLLSMLLPTTSSCVFDGLTGRCKDQRDEKCGDDVRSSHGQGRELVNDGGNVEDQNGRFGCDRRALEL
eukprot:752506-Hanusia_phi.AAC.16